MQRVKQGKEAKSAPKLAETGEKITKIDESASKSGKIFGDWTFERLEEEFGVKGRKAIFCARMATHENGTKAIIEAGYSENDASTQAYRFLKEPQISLAVNALRKAKADNIAEACGINAEWIVRKLTELHRNCSATYQKVGDDGSVRVAVEHPDTAMRTLETLGKIVGVIDPKKKADAVDAAPVTRVMIVRESASTDEWEKKLLAQQETLLNGN